MTQTADKVIVLLSGGLDSTVALAQAMAEYQILMAVTFSYGQRALKKELASTAAIADHYGLPHRIITLPWLAELLPQALQAHDQPYDRQMVLPQTLQSCSVSSRVSKTNSEVGMNAACVPVSGAAGADADPMAVETVWVPNRNGVFLNIAASLAEAHQARYVAFGANTDEGVDFPDNTAAYRDALNRSFAYSTLNHVQVLTPVGHLSKTEIIELGMKLNAPLDKLWSCYNSGDRHCGHCASCIRLKAAIGNHPLRIQFAE